MTTHDITVARYLEAVEHDDHATLDALWVEAGTDPELLVAFRDIHKGLIEEQNMTTEKVRYGRVSLRVPTHNPQHPRYESFLVKQDEDGSLSYMLGSVARTSDGWVTLAEGHRDDVVWDES